MPISPSSHATGPDAALRHGAMAAVGALSVVAAVLGLFWLTGTGYDREAPTDFAAAQRQAALQERLRALEDENRVLSARIAALESRMTQEIDALVSSIRGGRVENPRRVPDETQPMVLSPTPVLTTELTPLRAGDLLDVFGMPAMDLSQHCVEPSSLALLSLLETRDIGPFEVRMIRPALDSLERVLARVGERYPRLVSQLQTNGGFCARLIRGSEEAISRHGFGVAIDLSIGGTTDKLGTGSSQFGLVVLHEYFRAEGWIWGAAGRSADAMHFEVSAELFRRWRQDGLLGLPEPVADAQGIAGE